MAAEELVSFVLVACFVAFVVAACTFCATVMLARLRGASVDRQLRLVRWGRSAGLLLGICVLGLLLAAGWPYLAGGIGR